MGNEAKCRAVLAGVADGARVRRVSGKALLETEELIFRGEGGAKAVRAVFRFRELSSVAAEGGSLILVSEVAGRAELELGEQAAKWAAKIKSPKGRLEKMGVTADSVVALSGAALEAAFVDELTARAKSVGTAAPAKATTLAVLGVESAKDLARVAPLAKKLARLATRAALWIVFPKGRKDPREVDVLGAGRAAGMKDIKVVRFSETHTALKFVPPST